MALDMDELMEQLEDAEALLLEPRAHFDAALVGIIDGVAVYDCQRCIVALMEAHGWDEDEAQEWFEFNTRGAYVGPATPLFIDLLER